MNNYIKKFNKRIGIDGAIAFSAGSRIVQGFTGVGSVFFISTFLTGVEQGFYYTFGSILALQVFFELGLTGIMTQFVAHEASHLVINDQNEYEGNDYYKSRLASLVQFCIRWYSILSIIVVFFLLIIGFFYFLHYGSDSVGVEWKFPWLLICIGTGVKLFQSPFNSILVGLGKVKEMSKVGFWQQIIIPASVWVGLLCGFKLYVVGISYLLSVLLWIVFVYKTELLKLLTNLNNILIVNRVSYLKEIFPYQWKIALSWVSGYFIFQLFNPVLFATEGAIVAGQMGMTLTVLNAITSLSMSWINTKIPLFSKLIALKDYMQLDTIHKKTLKQMGIVSFFLLTLFIIMLVILRVSNLTINDSRLSDRFLSYVPVAILCIPVMTNLLFNSWATYLRCHKEEPYLVVSIVNGVLCMSSTLFLGNMWGLYGVVIGYSVIQILLIPWYYNIFIKKRKEWHG